MAPTLVITGGTSGIGRELVRRYHASGATVLTCGRNTNALQSLERELPGVVGIPCDLASADERASFVAVVAEHTDRVDGLINNAAVQRAYRFDSAPAGALEEEVAINLVAPIDLAHRLADRFARGAFVVNVGSGLAEVPVSRCPVYCATKAGLAHYSRAVNLQRPDVRFVNVVLPVVDTPMTAGRDIAKLSPADAARQIAAGIARGGTVVRVGKARLLPVLTALVPGLIQRMLDRPAALPAP